MAYVYDATPITQETPIYEARPIVQNKAPDVDTSIWGATKSAANKLLSTDTLQEIGRGTGVLSSIPVTFPVSGIAGLVEGVGKSLGRVPAALANGEGWQGTKDALVSSFEEAGQTVDQIGSLPSQVYLGAQAPKGQAFDVMSYAPKPVKDQVTPAEQVVNTVGIPFEKLAELNKAISEGDINEPPSAIRYALGTIPEAVLYTLGFGGLAKYGSKAITAPRLARIREAKLAKNEAIVADPNATPEARAVAAAELKTNEVAPPLDVTADAVLNAATILQKNTSDVPSTPISPNEVGKQRRARVQAQEATAVEQTKPADLPKAEVVEVKPVDEAEVKPTEKEQSLQPTRNLTEEERLQDEKEKQEDIRNVLAAEAKEEKNVTAWIAASNYLKEKYPPNNKPIEPTKENITTVELFQKKLADMLDEFGHKSLEELSEEQLDRVMSLAEETAGWGLDIVRDSIDSKVLDIKMTNEEFDAVTNTIHKQHGNILNDIYNKFSKAIDEQSASPIGDAVTELGEGEVVKPSKADTRRRKKPAEKKPAKQLVDTPEIRRMIKDKINEGEKLTDAEKEIAKSILSDLQDGVEKEFAIEAMSKEQKDFLAQKKNYILGARKRFQDMKILDSDSMYNEKVGSLNIDEIRERYVTIYKQLPGTRREAIEWDRIAERFENATSDKIKHKNIAWSLKTISKAQKKGVISKVEADYMRTVYRSLKQQPSMKFEIARDNNSDIQGSYDFVRDMLTINNPYAQAHEVGHWSFYNVLDKADRKAYRQYIIDEMYEPGPEGRLMRKKIIMENTDFFSADLSASEMFASKLSDFFNEKTLTATEKNLFHKVLDWFKELKHMLRNRGGDTKYDKIENIFNKVLESEGRRNKWREEEDIVSPLGTTVRRRPAVSNKPVSSLEFGTPEYSLAFFKSKFEDVIKAKPFTKMDAGQLRKMLENNGVTKDEIFNILGNETGTLTRQDVLDAIKVNKTEFEDVVLGEIDTKDGTWTHGATEYEHWQEPGAVKGSYRELFVTAPSDFSKSNKAFEVLKEIREIAKQDGKEVSSYLDLTRHKLRQAGLDVDKSMQYLDGLITRSEYEGKPEWVDGHRPYSNIHNPVVRIRYNDRIIGGKPTEESSLSFEDFKNLYRKDSWDKATTTKERDKIRQEYLNRKQTKGGKKILFIEEMQGPRPENQERMPDYLKKRIYDIGTKRVLALAKEKGYDGVAWTTGEMQADRYDLSKQLTEVRSFKAGDAYQISFTTKQGDKHTDQTWYKAEKLPDVVGKDLAEKIIKSDKTKNEFTGLDLKVGGEWTEDLYGKRIPSLMKKYGKEGISNIQLIEDAKAKESISKEELPDDLQTILNEVLDDVISVESGKDIFESRGYELNYDAWEDVLGNINKITHLGSKDVSYVPISPKTPSEFALYSDPFGLQAAYNGITKLLADKKLNSIGLSSEIKAVSDTIQNKFNSKDLTTLETILKSPEWFNHPKVHQIVKLFTQDARDIYHNIFNELNLSDHPDVYLGSLTKDAKALKHKGLTLAERLAGKTSEEYKHLQRIIDEGDTTWVRNKHISPEDNVKLYEAHIRKQGATEDTIRIWKLYRESYDKALDIHTEQVRKMIDALTEEARLKGETPDLRELNKTLKGALAQMEEWRGFYAPRVREFGNWKVQAYKENGPLEENRDWYRYHRGSELSARRLANKLEKEGLKIYNVGETEYNPKYNQNINAVMTAKMIESAIEKMSKREDYANSMLVKVNEEILREVANAIKSRGFKSSTIHRADSVVKGYIEDPIERHLMYTNTLSRGISKSATAKQAYEILLGQRVNGQKIGGIDPTTDPKAFEVAQDYIQDQLRNPDAADRAIGIAKSIATFKFLGFNLRSIAVNLTAMASTAPASIHQYTLGGKGSMVRIGAEISLAGKDYGKYMTGHRMYSDAIASKEGWSPEKRKMRIDEQMFMDDMHKKGWDDAKFTREAMNELSKTQSRLWNSMMEGSMWLFGKSEQWNRGTTMLAAYRMARHSGVGHEEATNLARTASDKAHGTYGEATNPMWAEGTSISAKAGQMLYVYSKFGHNYLQLLYDLGANQKNVKALLYASLAPMVIAGVAVAPFKDEIFAIAGSMLHKMGIRQDPEKWIWDEIRKDFGFEGEKVARHGLLGALGVDVSGSLSIGAGIPQSFIDLTGAIGGAYTDIAEGFNKIHNKQYMRAAEHMLPAGVSNLLKAAREHEEGITTKNNYRFWNRRNKAYMPSTRETITKALGFRSADQAVLQDRTFEANRDSTKLSKERSDIYERYRAWLLSPNRDPLEKAEIMESRREYNKYIRDNKLRREPYITRESLKRQRQQLRSPNRRDRQPIDYDAYEED